MKKEYNLLTQKLLAEGYTSDNYPDYVQIPSGCWGKLPLQNLHGGFEYTSTKLRSMVFKTGCGLFVKGSQLGIGSMSYMGILWVPENNNPVVRCPYCKELCDLRNQILGGLAGGGLCRLFQCDCHQTDEPYDYDKSIDKVRDRMSEERHRKYAEFSEKVHGHVCHWHMTYNECDGMWKQDYDPMTCARMCMNIGKICDLTQKLVSKKRGNVFYDVKVSYIRKDDTLFNGQEVVTIIKGKRLFETAKSITICEQVAKQSLKEIERKEKERYYAEVLLKDYKVEVLNVRAEQRESRNLMQDLQDIRDGIMRPVVMIREQSTTSEDFCQQFSRGTGNMD
ncbi:sarcolemmal membrane-associated protein [Diplocloster agilis]|uniref:sarcolemmal membrane-associated protein n=1 Tax=Diplocloster agilis TaxID=2850323 RepID=UPI00082155D9|nr:sarcolemmal membrane-associated protein [Suonthocola fibrivorans]MCU6737055.1 sarcolemmal membrane-associated protein [Suonthocola fibrivorans]SCJ95567.1 Uncharacterised protein [uncultured Clostridium sp.]